MRNEGNCKGNPKKLCCLVSQTRGVEVTGFWKMSQKKMFEADGNNLLADQNQELQSR